MSKYRLRVSQLIVSVILILMAAVTATASGPLEIGTWGSQAPPESIQAQSLSQFVNEFGRISLSMDAIGTLTNTGEIHIEKPEGATVRKAYLLSATTGFLNYQLNNGDVLLEGNPVVWAEEVQSSISSYNYWADVTAIIKSEVDAADPGIVALEITEMNSVSIDGEIMAVIFDDPNQDTDNAVLLYFGAQNINGDNFTIDFAQPIDIDDPNLHVDYSLGISYGYQEDGIQQFSIIDVNGSRLTTAAGGDDDGEHANGALITVGGVGDDRANPIDPFAPPTHSRSDDEAYDLEPFLEDGDTSVEINTINPSLDDNILFASVFLGTTRSIPTIDVDISLYNNPTSGDDREPYETIINYFADAIYEASNGAHKLGRVTFFPNGGHSDNADVIWVERCHPSADVVGVRAPGLHVNMCDIFENGGLLWFDKNFLSTHGNQRHGGYALGHEWGHYYYGLYDEYRGDGSNDHLVYHPHSTDEPVDNSIMNSQFKAHDILGDDFDWLNFSVEKNNTGETAQHRVYGASGWVTLSREPSEDPRDGEIAILPERIFYAELAEVAPGDDEDAQIDLPGDARSAVNIVWESSESPDHTPNELPYSAQIYSVGGANIAYPAPILLLAYVHKHANIAHLNLVASVQHPDGSTLPITFTDDGISPDAVANDGRYSAILNYDSDGLYTINAGFDNDSGNAAFVFSGVAPSIGEEGAVPLPPPEPVGENFHLSKTIQISISNFAPDDYGDVIANAHPLEPTNVDLPGRIDSVGDLDVFKLTTLLDESTIVRVTGLALDMNPRLRLFDASGTLLSEHTLNPALGAYLYVNLGTALQGSVVYVELSDVNPNAAQGLYRISAGTRLASDRPNHSAFLPIVSN